MSEIYKFLNHIFRKHKYPVMAVLAVLIIFASMPNLELSNAHKIVNQKINQIFAIGDISFKGASSGKVFLSGKYRGLEKSTYNIIINNSTNGQDKAKTFSWNKNGGPYETRPMAFAQEDLADGVKIRFDEETNYRSGDKWTINSSVPVYFNLANHTLAIASQKIASLYSDFSRATNGVAYNMSRLFSDSSNKLGIKKIIGVGGVVATNFKNNPNIGGNALFDIEISPIVDEKENKILPVVALFFIILVFSALIIFITSKIKKRSGPDKNEVK